MIQRWILNNFKSVQHADLQLAPLTLFAGANSSGKSTLLQSILLISQTLSSRVATQTVLLNGHFTKLGQLDDLCPSWSEHGNIRIGWTVKVSESEPELFSYRTSPTLESVSGEITFGPSAVADKVTQLNPLLIECTISCVAEKQGQKEVTESFLRLKRKPNTPTKQSVDAEAEQGVYHQSITILLYPWIRTPKNIYEMNWRDQSQLGFLYNISFHRG
jgi:ABC-type cobalamin/Fe3+-siderophores transport system ATPase subunit